MGRVKQQRIKIYKFSIDKTIYVVAAYTYFQAEICLCASHIDLDRIDENDDCEIIDPILWDSITALGPENADDTTIESLLQNTEIPKLLIKLPR